MRPRRPELCRIALHDALPIYTMKRPSVARHRPSVARHVERTWVRTAKVDPGAGYGGGAHVVRHWRHAPKDRREGGRHPSTSAPGWRTPRWRAGGAGGIKTPAP